MPYPQKKSFAAEQLRKRQKKSPATIAILVVAVIVAVIAVGYALYLRFEIKEIPPAEEITEGKPSIAVLPFDNLSDDKEDEFFSDGIHDDILTQLSKISELNVISRSSVIRYKGTDKSIPEIGKELGVSAILEGTIRRFENRVRITAQLINAKTDYHIWSDTYDREMKDIFEIQSDIARNIADTLRVELSPSEKERLAEKPTDNLEAYDFYLRGNDYRKRSYREENARIALQMYQKAIDLDPAFALAYATLSRIHTSMYWYYYDRTPERLAKAKEAADRALELNPDLPEAHVALGMYYYHGYLDYDRALEQFAIAQKNHPNNSGLMAAIGYVQRRQGKFEQALANIKKASELDPLSNLLAIEVGYTFTLIRNYPEAERYFDRAISLAPDIPGYYSDKAMLYISREGNTEKARAVLEEAIKNIGPEEISIINTLVTLDVYDENYQEALEKLSLKSEDIDIQYYFIPKALRYAQIYGFLNDAQYEKTYYDSARVILENKIMERPEDERLHSSLGITYAGLGRKEEAIREGKLASALLPVSKEALGGIYRIEDLARIYVMVGEYDSAIDQLDFLLSRPGYMTVHVLRLDPIWAPLRGHPRFQRLLNEG